MISGAFVLVVTIQTILLNHLSSSLKITEDSRVHGVVKDAVRDILPSELQQQQQHTIITLLDHSHLASKILEGGWGDDIKSSGIFQAPKTDNITLSHLDPIIMLARKLRLLSWNVTVIVISEDMDFLSAVGQQAMEGRLLIWATRLLVITRLPLQDINFLFTQHWTFEMMNTMFMNIVQSGETFRCGLYSNMPYSNKGGGVIRVASWTHNKPIELLSHLSLFPHKYKNFYNTPVNVTALPFPPYWDTTENTDLDGTTVTRFSGTDYLMLEAISHALNFTINVIPTSNWGEVTKRVEERVSFIATVIYAVFPQRLDHYDYTYMFEYAFHAFCMAKPHLKPQWQSLYYPLHDLVWLSVLATLIIVPLPLIAIMHIKATEEHHKPAKIGSMYLGVFGTLLGQDLNTSTFTPGNANRMLTAAWLIFAFIIGVAYRGNLTASLTAPKYPARVETLSQLVMSGAKVTMPPYGAQFQDFFKQSESSDFKTLGDRVKIVPSAIEGITQTAQYKQAHMEARRYLQLVIAEKFTKSDGTTQLYVARESVFPGLSAWPIPHDAPFTPTINRCIMAVKEGGLYEKWNDDVLSDARRASRLRQKNEQSEKDDKQDELITTAEGMALTVLHMQGPLMLLLLGLVIASVVFAIESIIHKCNNKQS